MFILLSFLRIEKLKQPTLKKREWRRGATALQPDLITTVKYQYFNPAVP